MSAAFQPRGRRNCFFLTKKFSKGAIGFHIDPPLDDYEFSKEKWKSDFLEIMRDATKARVSKIDLYSSLIGLECRREATVKILNSLLEKNQYQWEAIDLGERKSILFNLLTHFDILKPRENLRYDYVSGTTNKVTCGFIQIIRK